MGAPAARRIRTPCATKRPSFAPRKASGTELERLRVASWQVPILNLSVLLHCASANGQISAGVLAGRRQLVRHRVLSPLGLSDFSPPNRCTLAKVLAGPHQLADHWRIQKTHQGDRNRGIVLAGWVWFPSLRASPPPRGGQLGQSAHEWGSTDVVLWGWQLSR
jgi:hypothetical protein